MSTYRASARNLGAFVRAYRSKSPARLVMMCVTIFILPAVALLSGFQSRPGEVFAGDRSTNMMLGVLLLAFGVVMIVIAHRNATLAVDVHENGLRWTLRKLSRDILWDEILDVRESHKRRTRNGIEVGRSSTYRLRLENGDELVAALQLANVHELFATIDREVRKRLGPRIEKTLADGKTAHFGPISISSRGLEIKNREIAWHEVRSVEIVEGDFVVTVGGKDRVYVPWSEVPNARALVVVIAEKLEPEDKGAEPKPEKKEDRDVKADA